MAYPTDDLTTAELDAGTDDPSAARAELLAAVQKIQAMIAATGTGANNVPKLDASGYLPVALNTRFRGALVYKSANQSLSDDTTTVLTWNTETYDTDSIHDNVVSNSYLLVPAGVTRVRLSARVYFASNATGRRSLNIYNDTASVVGQATENIPSPGAFSFPITLTTAVMTVTPGDSLAISAIQNSGGALNVLGGATSSWFAMEIIE